MVASAMGGTAFAAQSPQVPLSPTAIGQFVQPLPTLNLACAGATCAAPGGINTVLGNKELTLKMCEFRAAVLPPATPVTNPYTWTWGYLVDPAGGSTPCATLAQMYATDPACDDSDPLHPCVLDTYLGPVIVNSRGAGPTDITWVNELGSASTTNVLAYKYSTDQTLHWADPLGEGCMEHSMMHGILTFGDSCAENYAGPIPAAPHLHGGEVPAEIDGSPDSWWTSDGLRFGHKYYTKGVVGEVDGLPDLPDDAYPPGAIVYSGEEGGWFQATEEDTWVPYVSNRAMYAYPNLQEAAPIWFHDHTLGATRLNVYAGVAGGYYIQDPAVIPVSAGGTCTAGCLPANLHPLTEVIPLILQDRMFDTDGQLLFQAGSAGGVLWAPNAEHPYWSPEFVGDTIVINGKAWPFHDVERKRYRFLFLNGSNARTYEMFLTDPVTKVAGPPMWVIGTDGGYLDAPVKIDPNAPKAPKGAPPNQKTLIIQPGERYEVIIDFGDPQWLALNPGFSGSLVLKNTGGTPFPKGPPPHGATLGKMMKFVVSPEAVADASYDPKSDGPLRSGGNVVQRLVSPATGALAAGVTVAKTRVLTLNEVMGMPMTVPDPVTGVLTAYPGGPLEVLVNNTKWAGNDRPGFTESTVNGVTSYLTEFPVEGDTEVWEIVNATADAHPIHLHAVQFQILNRQNYKVSGYTGAYDAAFPGGAFIPGYGPPLSYDVVTDPAGNPVPGKVGGNPDITPYLQGPVKPALPSEAGWKDTAITYPGQVTRYAVRWAPNSVVTGTTDAQELAFPFDPSGGGAYNYVWHCHIIDHEDNEMMRPDMISPLADVTRALVRGADY